MILNNNAVKIDSNIEPAKALNFGISDVRLVVDILSKLYAYPIRTLVQEYICNGRDAMREAKTWDHLPIDITVPNIIDPVFKVRDYGVGISPDRMENIFVNYGSSTKRGTNDQTGGFGIGAKSAFSYTDSFTITSFFNGRKYLYVAHLGDNGGVNLVSKEPTTEANGVEISIGVKPKDISEFKKAIERCVKFWTAPMRFLGGVVEVIGHKQLLSLGDMSVYKSDGEHRTIFLVDGIEYDLFDSEDYWMRNRKEFSASGHIVAIHVPNGHFKVASSRERLENNDDNRGKEKLILDKCNALIDDILKSLVNNNKRTLEARLEAKRLYSGFMKVSNTEFELGNGCRITHGNSLSLPFVISYRYMRYGRGGSKKIEIWNNSASIPLAHAVVYKSQQPDSNQVARKLNHYIQQHPNNKEIRVYSFEEIKKIPFFEKFLTTIIDADTLPMPPKNVAPRTAKTTRDAIVWKLTPNSNSEKSKYTIDEMNSWYSSNNIVFIEEITEEARDLSLFLPVFIIPKCNKDLITKKGLTIEQGQQLLLKENRGSTGLSNLPNKFTEITLLSKFKRIKVALDLQNYLRMIDPILDKELDDSKREYESLLAKYPLLTLLSQVSNHAAGYNILISEINKHYKGN